MIRKVLQQGPSSLVVSLPAGWVKQNQIRKGDEVSIGLEGDELVVSSRSESLKDRIIIDISNIERKIIEKYIDGAYMNGYSDITLVYKNRLAQDLKQKKQISVFEIIQERAKKLIGVEVVSHNTSECVIKEVAEVRKEELSNVMKYLFNLTNQFLLDAKDIIQSCDTSYLNEIDLKEDNIDKFVMLALRILNKKGVKKGAFYIYDSIISVESISDELAYFLKSRVLSGLKISDRRFIELYSIVIKSGELMQSIYFVFDKEKSNEFIRLRRQFYDKINNASREFKEKEQMHFLSIIMNNMLKVVSDSISASVC